MPIEIKIVGDTPEELMSALQDIHKLFGGLQYNLTTNDPEPVSPENIPALVEDGARLKDLALKKLLKYWDHQYVKDGASNIQKQFGVKRLREVTDDKGKELLDAVDALIASFPQPDAAE